MSIFGDAFEKTFGFDLDTFDKMVTALNQKADGTYKQDSADKLLQSFETIPREAAVSKDKAAIADIKELVQYLEKMVDGTLQEIDRQKIRQKKEEYGKSIELLTEMLLKRHKD